jgi:hypothetical protein
VCTIVHEPCSYSLKLIVKKLSVLYTYLFASLWSVVVWLGDIHSETGGPARLPAHVAG